MWEIKGKDNQVKATVGSLEYNGEWMGESYVTVTVESPAPINFEIGDYIIYRDERFEINYDPGKIKSAPRYEKGDAFKYENIKFNSLADELTRCDFRDVVLQDNNLHFTSLPKFPFYGGVKDLANRIQANLDKLYTGANKWSVVVSPEFQGDKELNVQVDNIKVQGALEILVNQFETYYTITGRTITIGAAGIPAGHLFKYGRGNGLYEIEQNAEADQAIVTRLRAYGSTRNLPHRYYNSLSGADGKKLIPDNMAVQYLMLPEFPYTTQDPYIDSPNIAKLGIREDTVFFDGKGVIEEIYPSIEGMTAEQLKAAGVPCNSTGALDEIVSAEQMTDNGVGEINEGETQTTAKPPTFKVTLKDLGFDINDHIMTETATLSFKTGMLGGRDFEIVGCKKIESGGKVTGYELELNRVYDDGIKLWFPYSAYNAQAGDKFVILYVEMPEVYIKAAAQRLKEAATGWLSKNDYSRSIYAPKVDEIFMARQHDLAMASGGKIKSLHDTLKEGMLLLFEDEDLNIDASIFIDRLTIKEEGAVPTYEVVLKEEKTVGRLDKMQNQIDSLVAGKGQGGGGYTAAQIRSMIEAYGDTRFLSKLKDDRTPYKLSTDKAFEVGRYLAGVSGGIFGMDDDTGDSFAEVARLYVRVRAFFEELTIIKAGVLAGKQYITPGGGIKCTKVDDAGSTWRCWFLSEQDGEKTETKIEAGDQAIAQVFNAKEGTANKVSNHRYWRLVTAVDNDALTDDAGNHYGYIELSKTVCEAGSDTPKAGDEICQLGYHGTDNPQRQTAMVFSTVDADAPSIKLFSGINSFSLAGKAVVAFGRDAVTGKVFFRLGASGARQFLEYTQDDGLRVAGRISAESTYDDGSGNDRTLGEVIVSNTEALYISHTSPSQQDAPSLPTLDPNGLIADARGWAATAPEWQEGRYIWQTTYVRRGDGSASFSDPTCIQGANGKSVSMTSTEVRYSTVHTATQPADATFTLSAVPSLAAGQYLWSRTRVGYDNGDSTTTYAVSRLGENGADGTAWGNGKMLFNDPTFRKGSNKVFPYSHPSPGTLTVTRIDDASAPNDSGKVLRIRSIGELKPGLGGFYQVTQARASATFIQRFVARIPRGYTLAFGHNNIGTPANGAKVEWLTPNAGTGKWEEYMLKFRIADIPDNGSQTVFSTFGHIYLTGSVYGTEEAPVDWYLAYATTFDMDANGEFLIESQSVTYAKTTVATQPADSAFIYTSLGAAGVGPGDYLWCKTEVKYSDGTVVKSYSVSRIGSDGETSIAGLHLAYASDITGQLPHPTSVTGFSTTMFEGARYIGIYKDDKADDSTDFRKYEWARLQGTDGKWRKFQWAKNTDTLNEPTSGWSDNPITAPPGEYVWMRSGLVVPPATVPAKWDKAMRLTGDTGAAGSDVYRLDIDNEVAAVACNAAGTPISYPPPANASVYKGGTRLTSGVSYSIPQTSGIFADISDKGAIMLRGMEADTAEITVQARVGSVTLTTVMSVYKVRPGADGSPAVIYKLMPSVNNITIDANGHLSTNAVSCKVYRTTGASTPVLTGERQLKYQRIGIDSYEHPVTLTNGTSPAIAVTEEVEAVVFTLYDGSTMLDRERIFVIADARGLAIGGENLLRNSDFIDGSLHWRTYPADSGCVDFNAGAAYDHLGRKSAHLHVSGAQQDTWATVYQNFDGYTPGEVHMFSGYVYTDNLAGIDGSWLLEANTDSTDPDFKKVIIATKNVLVEGKFVFISGKVYIPTDATTVGVAAKVQRNGSFYINSWKVERGNKATAWSASAKDTGYLRQALGQDTDVTGGVILSSLIQARDVDGNVTAGINGIANSGRSIAIWGGGPLRDAAYESDGAAFALRHDGSVYAAHNTVRFEERRMEVGDNLRLDHEGLTMFGPNGQTHLRVADKPIDDSMLDMAEVKPIDKTEKASASLIHPKTAQGAVSTAWTFGYSAFNEVSLGTLQNGTRIELAIEAAISSRAPAQPLTGNLVAEVHDSKGKVITAVSTAVRGNASSASAKVIISTIVPATDTYKVEWWFQGTGAASGETVSADVTTTAKGRTASGDTDLVVIGNNGLLAKFGLTKLYARDGAVTMEAGDFIFEVSETDGIRYKGRSDNWKELT